MGISKQRMDSKYDFGGRLSESPVLTLTHQQHQQHLHANYLRNSKAIGVLWGVFTICFAIIDVVVFLQPHWLGDTQHSKGTGHFGLWQFCRLVQDGQEVVCEGRLDSFQSIPSPAFRAATVFVGLSVVAVLLCIGCMLLFFVVHSSTVFHVCGWLQVFCALCLVVGVLAFPAGWGALEVRDVCGPEADSYEPAQCGIRWAYILAIIGVCDCATLAALAFVLGTRYVKLLPDHYITNGGEVNTAFLNDTQSVVSRKSVQPVLLMPAPPAPGLHHPGHPHHHMNQVIDPERFSEYSHRTGRSGSRVDNYGNPPSIRRNFQL